MPRSPQCPPGDISPLSPLGQQSPLAPQLGVTEAGLQRAILRRAQEILAVAATIPGTPQLISAAFYTRSRHLSLGQGALWVRYTLGV